MSATYKIIRMRFRGNNTVIKTGLTLEEAQAHCSRDDTRGEGWFDGYEQENKTAQEIAEEERKTVALLGIAKRAINL
jgi:hypothetical protein